MKTLNIGLFGFGVVGEGIFKVLDQQPELGLNISKIVVKDQSKNRNAPNHLFKEKASDILNDPGIDLVIELIDDDIEAFEICNTALKKGKSVVSANKKMVANKLKSLQKTQHEYGGALLYEAAVCGSIPIIRNLEEFFKNDKIKSLSGILNGSTNFILSKMYDSEKEYATVLKEAQDLGFAESNPKLDVEGYDSAYKLGILLFHAYGQIFDPNEIQRRGITELHPSDFKFAKNVNKKIKLIGHFDRLKNGNINAYVLPQFVDKESQFHQINNEFNGVAITSNLADEQFLSGKGAGRFPTSSAVLSDISSIKDKYVYPSNKNQSEQNLEIVNDKTVQVYVSFNTAKLADLSLFIAINEQHLSPKRNYLIGYIKLQDLQKSIFWTDPNVSIIIIP